MAVIRRTVDEEPPGRVGKYIRAHSEGFRRIEAVVLGVLFLILLGMLLYGFSRVLVADVTKCAEKKTATFWPTGVGLTAAASLGFVGGRLVGYLRKSRYGGAVKLTRDPAVPLPTVGVMLAIFLVAATLLLGYETFAVVHTTGGPPPITSYVRCAAADKPWISAVGASIISLFLGNWIWYPTRKRPWRPDRD